MTKLTVEKVKKAIEKSYGNMTLISTRCGVARKNLYEFLEKEKSEKSELVDLIKFERERIVDLAENKLLKNVEDGDNTSIIFVCKTLGKDRGYVEKSEQVFIQQDGDDLISKLKELRESKKNKKRKQKSRKI